MNKFIKPRILFIIHVPPPITGAGVIGKLIMESNVVNSRFDTAYINLATSFEIEEIGKGNFEKFKIIRSILSKVYKVLSKNDINLCYLTLTTKGVGFYKDVFVVLLLKLFRKKIVYHFHNKGVRESSIKWYNHILYRIVFHNTFSILLSPLLYYDIGWYVKKERVFFCPNGIPKISHASFIKTQKSQDSVFQILFLSNMMREKGVIELLEACNILKQRGFKFQCIFIGAWSDISEADFISHVQRLGIKEEVQVHGKKYDDEKSKFFNAADAFVLPTYYHNECFPLVLLEAMKYGLPIISTFEGAISEIVIDRKTGFLIKQRDTGGLATAIAKLIDNRPLAQKMGELAQCRFEELYTVECFENKISDILEKIIDY